MCDVSHTSEVIVSTPARTRIQSPLPERELYTLREAVALGWAAHSTLRKYIREGRLPAVKVFGVTKVHRSDLEALAEPVKPRGRRQSGLLDPSNGGGA